MKKLKYIFTALLCFSVSVLFAQNYVSKVSRDSVSILSARLEVLKMETRVNQLKLTEAKQEADIEKQKLKIIDLRGSDKDAARESARLADALKEGKETDMKKAEKMSRKASGTAKDLKNALERLQKQIDQVEETRAEIQTEERKLTSRNPIIIYKN